MAQATKRRPAAQKRPAKKGRRPGWLRRQVHTARRAQNGWRKYQVERTARLEARARWVETQAKLATRNAAARQRIHDAKAAGRAAKLHREDRQDVERRSKLAEAQQRQTARTAPARVAVTPSGQRIPVAASQPTPPRHRVDPPVAKPVPADGRPFSPTHSTRCACCGQPHTAMPSDGVHCGACLGGGRSQHARNSGREQKVLVDLTAAHARARAVREQQSAAQCGAPTDGGAGPPCQHLVTDGKCAAGHTPAQRRKRKG